MVNNYEGDVAWNIEGGKAGSGGVIVQYTQHSFATRVPTFEPYVGVDAETQQHLETRKVRTRLKSRKRGILLYILKNLTHWCIISEKHMTFVIFPLIELTFVLLVAEALFSHCEYSSKMAEPLRLLRSCPPSDASDATDPWQ